MNVTYNYTAGANNGRIASMTESGAGETITYQYDSLNRLIAANSTGGWNTTYGYDGWGNLNSKGGSSGVPYINITTDPSTNGSPGISGVPYSKPSAYNYGIYIVPQYDVEGHQLTDGGRTWWVYDPWGRRIWQETLPSIGRPGDDLQAYLLRDHGQAHRRLRGDVRHFDRHTIDDAQPRHIESCRAAATPGNEGVFWE